MKNLRLSVHSSEYLYLRNKFLQRRLDLGLSQRAFVGKVETGDRRLDIFELMEYCARLDWDAAELVQELRQRFG